MNILLVNDDGIDSPNLALLCQAAVQRGHRVTVCAPARQQSAKSHCFTVFTPLLASPREMPGAAEAWALEGTPADCTRIGLMNLCPETDLVFSGINQGYNAGLAVFVSGTVGAAREAVFQGVPAIAVSAEPQTPADTLAFFADYAVRLGERLVHYPAPELSVCNLNAPCVPLSQVREAKMCPISRNIYKDSYERRVSPRGQTYFWLAPLEEDDAPTPGSDMDLLQRGHITCTFLTPDDGCDQQAHQALLAGLD